MLSFYRNTNHKSGHILHTGPLKADGLIVWYPFFQPPKDYFGIPGPNNMLLALTKAGSDGVGSGPKAAAAWFN